MIRQIGELNKRIQIQRLVVHPDGKTTDAKGMPLPEEWKTVFSRWAKKEDVSGREYFKAGAEQSLANTVFTIRWTDGITENMRVLYKAEAYYIVFPSEIKGVGDFMELHTSKKKPEAG